MTADAFRRDAREVLRRELRRRQGALARLPAESRGAVDESVARIVDAVVDGVLDHARYDPRVASALEAVYGDAHVLDPATVAPD
jgi:hypothetical protein